MPESATSARLTVSVRMVQAATLLTISGLTIAAHYTGTDAHTGIFMSGIAIGVIPVLLCMQYILCIEGRRVEHAKHMERIIKPLARESVRRARTMLELLKALPVQYLRIDGDMTREVERDPALAWLKGLCRVSRAIGVRVITGQVESGSLRATLRAAGVDYVQGYGIMRALPHAAPVHH